MRCAAGLRLIPARAGNTCSGVSSSPVISAHPRARGEHSALRLLVSLEAGSSPRARGTPAKAKGQYYFNRLIPARAGNTTLKTPDS